MKKELFALILLILVGSVSIGYYFGFDHGFEKEKNDDVVGEFWGVIQGNVLLGPTCPVVQNPPDPQCADRPFQTQLAVTTPDGSRVIKEFSSRPDGTFYVEVPPGQYAIRSAAVANILPYCATNDIISVSANGYAETTVSCDTGIR